MTTTGWAIATTQTSYWCGPDPQDGWNNVWASLDEGVATWPTKAAAIAAYRKAHGRMPRTHRAVELSATDHTGAATIVAPKPAEQVAVVTAATPASAVTGETSTTYRDAAITLWGDAGAYAHDAYRRHRHLFPELPDELPIVIGLTAYGKCSGLTRGGWKHGPRISVASNLFAKGARVVDDLLVHEMLHAWLYVTGHSTHHDSADWYAAVRRLSPAVLGHDLDVRRGAERKSVRVVDADGVSRVRKVKVAEHEGMHDKVSRWPSPFRPIG